MSGPRIGAIAVVTLIIGLVLPARAGEDGQERREIFSRFDHEVHEHSLRAADLDCVACHQVGESLSPGASRQRLSDIFLSPPRESCHQCHAPGEGGLGEARRGERRGDARAPRECATCHPRVEAPDSHLVGWLALHGGESRGNAASCRDCHDRADCTDCHDRRSTAGQAVHDRSWLSVHGIAVRANPAACDSCHALTECTSCHASTGGWGRNP